MVKSLRATTKDPTGSGLLWSNTSAPMAWRSSTSTRRRWSSLSGPRRRTQLAAVCSGATPRHRWHGALQQVQGGDGQVSQGHDEGPNWQRSALEQHLGTDGMALFNKYKAAMVKSLRATTKDPTGSGLLWSNTS